MKARCMIKHKYTVIKKGSWRRQESPSTVSTFQLFAMYPDVESARKYLEGRLWKNGTVCPKCKGKENITTRKGGYYRYNPCPSRFHRSDRNLLAQLKGTDALTSRNEQVHGIGRLVEGNVATFKD